MKMMRVLLVAGIAAMGVGMVAGKAMAEEAKRPARPGAEGRPGEGRPGEGRPGGPGGPLMGLIMGEDGHRPLREALQELGLSEEQKTEVKAILEKAKEKLDAWREAHKTEIDAIKEEMKAAREAKDPEKFKAIREKVEKLVADAPKPHEVMEKLKDVLTPEQAEKLKAKMEELREKMQQRRGGEGGPGAGGGANRPGGTRPAAK